MRGATGWTTPSGTIPSSSIPLPLFFFPPFVYTFAMSCVASWSQLSELYPTVEAVEQAVHTSLDSAEQTIKPTPLGRQSARRALACDPALSDGVLLQQGPPHSSQPSQPLKKPAEAEQAWRMCVCVCPHCCMPAVVDNMTVCKWLATLVGRLVTLHG